MILLEETALSGKKTVNAMKELTRLASNMTGANFALCMRENDGSLKIHTRENQPCQGGEMRKYGETHKDCTRPDDPRPGDLRHPFPSGIPEAVSVCLSIVNRNTKPVLEFITGQESPYRSVMKDVRIIDDGRLIGLVFLDTEVDSTVLVNSIQAIRSLNSVTHGIMQKTGLDAREAFLFAMSGIHASSKEKELIVCGVYSYYFATNACIRRIWDGIPYDLTGGTYRDRYDYNRPAVQDLFMARQGEHKTNLLKELGVSYGKTVEIQRVRDVISEALEKQSVENLYPNQRDIPGLVRHEDRLSKEEERKAA